MEVKPVWAGDGGARRPVGIDELGDDVHAGVGEIPGARGDGVGGIGVDGLAEPPVEGVVGVGDRADERSGAVEETDVGQTIAVIPGVFRFGASGDDGFTDEVALVVIVEAAAAVGEQTVVLAVDRPIGDHIAGRVIIEPFIRQLRLVTFLSTPLM